ncbi:uncharacterized protein N7498_003641 [Penicillium cinerascens]|uniref:Uncharacterized protein n=1 Tax=Penicillium cinerascens TaxID=70096 RepID=A0A9W9N2K8_9EURO|nr:uncharacterized protein N7498_003641 [Penicillium cinerascens]KAJ5211995.1 hypothetical protein N7498_003641 [Penicillium cinerascens]
MQSASMQFSPVKDGRRILGEKDTNACLSPAHQSKQPLSVATTPVKRSLFMNTSPKKLLPSPIFAGQKRTRDQVDETDVNNGHVQEPRGLEGESSQSTVKHDSQKLDQESDAMGIRVPTPPSQPERDQTQDPMDTDRLSTASQSLEKETRPVPEDPEARKMFIQEKATLLRNTLQSAMRNVTDHQIDRRVSELEAHSRKCPRLSFSALSSHSMAYGKHATPSQFRTPRIGTTAEMSSTPSQKTPDLPTQSSTGRAKTSHRTPPRTLGSPMQLSSPPATVVRYAHSHDVTAAAKREDDAMRDNLSPSQRGDAVDGLLKLMSTSERNSTPNSWTG